MDGGLSQHTWNENPDPENPVFRSRTQNNKAGKNGQANKDKIKIRTTTDRGSDFAKITVSLIVIYISLIYIVKYLSSFGNPYSSEISGRFLFSIPTLSLLNTHAFSSQYPRFLLSIPTLLPSIPTLSLLNTHAFYQQQRSRKK